jgi:acyl-CoA thioester hydrolase
MYTHTTQVRVRYGETDQMGYLYYGNYALYYEVGRTEAIRSLGLSYKEMEENGVALPVIKCESRYLRPAFYDQLITIKTMVKTLPEKSEICFETELYNEKNKLLNVGITTLVFYDIHLKKKTSAPSALIEKLSPFFS